MTTMLTAAPSLLGRLILGRTSGETEIHEKGGNRGRSMNTKKEASRSGNSKHLLLIASVDDCPEPVIASIYRWRPGRIVFVRSDNSADGIDRILGELKNKGCELSKDQYSEIVLLDASDFAKCVQEMVDGLAAAVAEWCGKDDDFECIVDFTGGTKCMTAALALVARPWPKSSFSYVGANERGLGEGNGGTPGPIVRSVNPWNALGYQAVEDSVEAFDRHAFSEGSQILKDARDRIPEDSLRKSELNDLAMFMDAYDSWSRSEYAKAFNTFNTCFKNANNIAASLNHTSKKYIANYTGQAISRLSSLKKGSDRPTRELLEDLISDAWRRRHEGRHVDAVARLYRAVEATAQLRMFEKYGIRSTGKVLVSKLPESMRERLGLHSENSTTTRRWDLIEFVESLLTRTRSTGEKATGQTVALGLQGSYEFLIQKGDPLGERFKSLGWNGKESPLSMRNNSIAGHGFAPVSSEISDRLWKGTLELAELSEEQVFRFPRLGPLDAA